MKREELLRERLKRYSASETAAFHIYDHATDAALDI